MTSLSNVPARGTILRAAIGAASCGLALLIGASPAAWAATTPTVYLDYGNVVTAGSLLHATRVPILTSTGVVIYKDVTIQFLTNGAGTLTFTSIQQPSLPIAPNLSQGIYYLPGFPTFGLQVTGPGPGGIWTIAAAPKYNPACGGPMTVSAYTTANPNYARLQRAGIKPDPNTLYGVIGAPTASGSYCPFQDSYVWTQGSLVGVQQSGSSISIESYSYDGSSDRATPFAETALDLVK